MREAKFRQPIFLNGKFHDWHYWGFINDAFIGGIHNKGKDIAGDSYQFTGLHDKNGKEIYEGDILKARNGKNFRIEWAEGLGCFDAISIDGDDEMMVLGWNLAEVIGNIYESPELLKE